MLEKLVQKLLPLIAVGSLYADTSMTVTGPTVTYEDFDGDGMNEKKWEYKIINTSSTGDVNNMINFQINVGSNNNVNDLDYVYNGSGTINLHISYTNAGFNGVLPPGPAWPNNNNNNSIQLYLITPADTQPAPNPGLATAKTPFADLASFNSVAVQVPADLPTSVKLESAIQVIDGQTEIRYKITNLGTAIINSVDIPVGTNNQLSEIYVPTGVTSKVNEINSHITKSSGINLRESVIYRVKSVQQIDSPANAKPLNAKIIVGSQELYQGVPIPGETMPRPFQTVYNNGLQAIYYTLPGTEVSSNMSTDMQSWTSNDERFKMPYDSNLLQISLPSQGPRGFARLEVNVPDVLNNPAILQEVLPTQAQQRSMLPSQISPGVTITSQEYKPVLLKK